MIANVKKEPTNVAASITAPKINKNATTHAVFSDNLPDAIGRFFLMG